MPWAMVRGVRLSLRPRPVHTSSNVEAILSNATSQIKSNQIYLP